MSDLTIRQAVNLMHLVSGRPELSTARYDHDEGCSRIDNEAGKCDCSRAVLSPSGKEHG